MIRSLPALGAELDNQAMEFEPAVRAPASPTALAWSFAFAEGHLLLAGEDFTLDPGPSVDAQVRHYLGRLGGLDAWAFELPEVPTGWRGVSLRAAMMNLPPVHAGLAGRAAQLLEWDRAHRYCGVCGTPTSRQAHERSRRCPACGHQAYPRLAPAMMVLIWRPGEVLLARSPRFAKGTYSALAGFVEPGETIEECVRREAFEEVGVRLRDLRYFGSQSWPFPNSLMIAFTARWDGGDIVAQADEIEDAQWFAVDALPGVPARFSISGHLIRDTVAALLESREP
jgi:NAD+ diphosphatase